MVAAGPFKDSPEGQGPPGERSDQNLAEAEIVKTRPRSYVL
ncbi:hypothetical protein EDF56_105387 [Novosphingobium sp. PhB165]|nr:hypothetical protein EDF56_105387 [Novosphingobium sp. PhB165]